MHDEFFTSAVGRDQGHYASTEPAEEPEMARHDLEGNPPTIRGSVDRRGSSDRVTRTLASGRPMPRQVENACGRPDAADDHKDGGDFGVTPVGAVRMT